ncbi:MAG: metal-dependent hydrolase [Promethearchaeota archaeon]
MDIFTHTLIGILAYFPLVLTLSSESVLFLVVMAIFPDIDLLFEPISRKYKLYYLSHRAGTHSYVSGLFFTGIFSLIISILTNGIFIEIWIAGFIGYSLHVTLDLFTASKVPIFYPISKKEYRFLADRAINPILFIFSGINFFTLFMLFLTIPNYYLFRALTTIYSSIYLCYFGARAILRILVQVKLQKNQHYVPGILPWSYFIYEKDINEDGITFKLMKKFVFSSRRKEIFNHNILKNSENMLYYELAESLSQEYRFFHKWDSIIPFFQENKNSIQIVLILAESYSRRSSYFLSIIFDKKNKQIKFEKEGFGSFKKWKNGF